MGGGVSISEDQRAAMHASVLGALPAGVYALEEMRYKTGSFYESPEFAPHQESRAVFGALGLHEWSVSQLWRHFRLMNQTGDGVVTLWEFREYFDLPDDRSTTRLFRCFDEDRDNRIGFLELVVGLWTYCCNCNASVVCLCFDLYDTDHNGQIGPDEFDFAIEDVFGQEWEENEEAKSAHSWYHQRDDAVLGFPELGMNDWSAFVSASLQIQAPAVRTRLIFQKKILGVGFWTYCLRKSMTIFLGRTATVEKVLSAHVSDAVLEELAQDRKLELDHDDSTQFTMRVLRRTGPFPRRRKYRAMAAKKAALKAAGAAGGAANNAKKFTTVTVREAFERVTVPAGQDATWEEVKPPSMLQALMASITAIVERPSPLGAARNGKTSPQPESEEIEPSGSPSFAATNAKTAKKGPPPDALSLLKNRPGIDGAPLGSPTASPSGGGGGGVEDDPAIANVFYGLKPLPVAEPAPQKRRGGGGRKTASASRRVTAKVAKGAPSSSGSAAAAGTGAARPLSAGRGRAVGGGKSTLSRTGKELVCSGEIGGVGARQGDGDGNGGEGALSARVLGGVTAR